MKYVTILGATGSIGKSTLDVVSRHPDLYRIFALTANTNIDVMVEQCQAFQPQYAVMACADSAKLLKDKLAALSLKTTVLHGVEQLCAVSSDSQVDIVMAAIVGANGLLPTLAAVNAGKRVLLANKESLVMSGEIFMESVRKHNATLLPVDSEHNAIFQCLPGALQSLEQQTQTLDSVGVSKILLTGSGGPFLTRPLETLSNVTVAEAVAHPNWSMGRKISVDSATMMNKGLEFIEACWLFNLKPDDVEVVLHPQSVIHSMVQYRDGSVIAQLGNPDMRTPIAHGMAWPDRIDAGVKPLDFSMVADFTFARPDYSRYKNLKLAIDAFSVGQGATTVLNAANEETVAAFLNDQIKFTDIADINEYCLDHIPDIKPDSLDAILAIDEQARHVAQTRISEVVR